MSFRLGAEEGPELRYAAKRVAWTGLALVLMFKDDMS